MGKVAQNNMLVFTKNYGRYMLDALNGTAIFFPVMLAQASLESGYGTSNAAKNKNNFFGVMYGGTTKKFDSPRDAFQKQVELFYKPTLPYAGNGVITANTPYEQARRIADSGYYSLHNDDTLPDYMKKKIAKYGFTKKDSADWYYSKLKGFIDDALFVLPLGKINNSTYAQAGNIINQKTSTI
jgi:hypothetical protein